MVEEFTSSFPLIKAYDHLTLLVWFETWVNYMLDLISLNYNYENKIYNFIYLNRWFVSSFSSSSFISTLVRHHKKHNKDIKIIFLPIIFIFLSRKLMILE